MRRDRYLRRGKLSPARRAGPVQGAGAHRIRRRRRDGRRNLPGHPPSRPSLRLHRARLLDAQPSGRGRRLALAPPEGADRGPAQESRRRRDPRLIRRVGLAAERRAPRSRSRAASASPRASPSRAARRSANILGTSALYDDPEAGPTVLHFPVPLDAEGVTIKDNWRVLGMRGTGSNDIDLARTSSSPTRRSPAAVRRARGTCCSTSSA